MVCFDTTFPKGRICRYTHRNIWTRLLGNSTSGHARRWSSQLRQKHLMHVLHRPVEPADIIIHRICAMTNSRICRGSAPSHPSETRGPQTETVSIRCFRNKTVGHVCEPDTTFELENLSTARGACIAWAARIRRHPAAQPTSFPRSTFQLSTLQRHSLDRLVLALLEVAPVCGQLGGLFKVYTGCRSSCQNILGSIFLSPLLRLWVSGQGA